MGDAMRLFLGQSDTICIFPPSRWEKPFFFFAFFLLFSLLIYLKYHIRLTPKHSKSKFGPESSLLSRTGRNFCPPPLGSGHRPRWPSDKVIVAELYRGMLHDAGIPGYFPQGQFFNHFLWGLTWVPALLSSPSSTVAVGGFAVGHRSLFKGMLHDAGLPRYFRRAKFWIIFCEV